MKANLKNYRQSPRKVRLLADLVRGKKVDDALITLSFTPKRASEVMSKIISSAAANAENNFKSDKKDLVIENVTVDEGVVLKRFRARACGRAGRILKRTSNISVKLADSTIQSSKTETTEKPKSTVKKDKDVKAVKKPKEKVKKVSK